MLITEQNHKDDLGHIFDMEILGDVPKKGIIHIGAHQGQEVEQYLLLGFAKIILVEANPVWYEFLKAKFGHLPQIKIFNYAICDYDGETILHIHTSRSGSTEPASIFAMKRFQEIVNTLHTPEHIKVRAIKLDTLLKKYEIVDYDYNFLNLDIQGAEFLAIQGGVNTLKKLDVVISEVNLLELYENGATEEKIVSLLWQLGFKKKKAVYHSLYEGTTTFPAWGECLFVRSSIVEDNAV